MLEFEIVKFYSSSPALFPNCHEQIGRPKLSRIIAHYTKFSRKRQDAPQRAQIPKGNLKVIAALILRGRLSVLKPQYENYQTSTQDEPTSSSNTDTANQAADIRTPTRISLACGSVARKGPLPSTWMQDGSRKMTISQFVLIAHIGFMWQNTTISQLGAFHLCRNSHNKRLALSCPKATTVNLWGTKAQ